MKHETVPVDAIKNHYVKIKNRLMTTEDIRQAFPKEYIMQIFLKGIREKLIKGECLSILIKAQTTKGKSTLGFFLMWIINELIKDLKMDTTYTGEKNLFEYISSNQIEFTRVARRHDLFNVATAIDEFSHLGKTGAQSTIEEQMFKWRANVCAQKFIHTIMCTPSGEFDHHALIIMEIIDKDEKEKTTLCKLYYNDPTTYNAIYLGNLIFDVGEILNKDWYKLYRIKKFFAIELTEKDMIRDVRELEEALVILLTYEKCRQLAEVGHSDRNLTKCRVRDSSREIGSVYSIVGEEIIYKFAQSLIDLKVTQSNLQTEIRKKRTKPLTTEQISELAKKISIYTKQLNEELEKYKSLTKLYLKYLSIGENQLVEETLKICKKYNIEVGEIDPMPDIKRINEKYNLKFEIEKLIK